MTISNLHKLLGGFIASGHGRKAVCVSKETFRHPLESDGATILEVDDCFLQWVPMVDDDGGTKQNKDGTESGKACAVIVGSAFEEEEIV